MRAHIVSCVAIQGSTQVIYFLLYFLVAHVGPGHCWYRTGPIRFLAGWRKRRPEPELVWFS